MIATDLNHIDQQVLMTGPLNKGIDFLRRLDTFSPDRWTDGKVEIEGQSVYALFQSYETVIADVPKFECHQKYIDIQYIVSGEEIIGWAPAALMTDLEAYNVERDISFGKAPKNQIASVYLQAGQLAILYPDDGHAPRLAVTTPSKVFKVVIKVAIS